MTLPGRVEHVLKAGAFTVRNAHGGPMTRAALVLGSSWR